MHYFDSNNWQEYVQNRVIRKLEQFGEVLLSRLVPVFDGINQQATNLEQRRYKELTSTLDVPDDDPDYYWEGEQAAAELAFLEASEYAENLSSVKQATLNLYAAAIYHSYEQDIVDLYLRILYWDYPDFDFANRQDVRVDQAAKWFNASGLNLERLSNWPRIEELRLVANAVKHGEGPSAEQLWQLRPELFVHPALRDRRALRMRVRNPIFGQDIYISRDDLAKYVKGTVSFWNEVAVELGTRGRTLSRI